MEKLGAQQFHGKKDRRMLWVVWLFFDNFSLESTKCMDQNNLRDLIIIKYYDCRL